MLNDISKHVESHVIITDKKQPIINGKSIYPNKKLNKWNFSIWAFKQVIPIINKHKDSKIVVTEFSVCIVLFLIMMFGFNNVIKVASLYSCDIKYIQELGWQVDPNGREHISFSGKLKVILRQPKILFYRIISVLSADYVIGNSKDVLNDCKLISSKKRHLLINSSITINRLNKLIVKEKENSYNDASKIKIMFAGNLIPAKGLGTTVSALAKLNPEFLEKISFEIIGNVSSEYLSWFESLLSNLPEELEWMYTKKVKQSELFVKMALSQIFIFSSFIEGSPRIVKEALLAKMLIISSDIAGTRMIDPMGETILFFEKGNDLQLSELICDCINNYDDHIKKIELGFDLVKKFDTIQIANEWVKLYDQIYKDFFKLKLT